MPDELRLWFWTITDPVTKRRIKTRHRMTEDDALARYGGDAVKVERSLEIRPRTNTYTGDFLRKQ